MTAPPTCFETEIPNLEGHLAREFNTINLPYRPLKGRPCEYTRWKSGELVSLLCRASIIVISFSRYQTYSYLLRDLSFLIFTRNSSETVSCFLPFVLRLLSTRRPVFDSLRERKPWTFILLCFLGCHVRLVAITGRVYHIASVTGKVCSTDCVVTKGNNIAS